MLLQQTPKLSPGNRVSITKLKLIGNQTKVPNFFLGYKKSAGRGLQGQKTVLSKTTFRLKNFVSKKQSFFYPYSLSLLVKTLYKQYNKIAMGVNLTSEGLWYLKPVVKGDFILSFNQTMPSTWAAGFGLKPRSTWPSQLSWLSPGSLVSFLPSKFGFYPKIACAPGSVCQLLASKIWNFWALCRLPSGQLRFFDKKTIGIPAKLEPSNLNHVFSSKAGFHVSHGRRPMVRGVVKNTCDHPHGGKGRSPKCPKTPWGKIARKPRLKKSLRRGFNKS